MLTLRKAGLERLEVTILLMANFGIRYLSVGKAVVKSIEQIRF